LRFVALRMAAARAVLFEAARNFNAPFRLARFIGRDGIQGSRRSNLFAVFRRSVAE